jgi:hypothetical protein
MTHGEPIARDLPLILHDLIDKSTGAEQPVRLRLRSTTWSPSTERCEDE